VPNVHPVFEWVIMAPYHCHNCHHATNIFLFEVHDSLGVTQVTWSIRHTDRCQPINLKLVFWYTMLSSVNSHARVGLHESRTARPAAAAAAVAPHACRSRRSSVRVHCAATGLQKDWRAKSKPIQPGSNYPAQQFCSHCGLCKSAAHGISSS
jgi:hypothetical protein